MKNKKATEKAADKRGKNSKAASKILKENRRLYQLYFKQEVGLEKIAAKRDGRKTDITKAAKKASSRYKSRKITWKQALRQASKK